MMVDGHARTWKSSWRWGGISHDNAFTDHRCNGPDDLWKWHRCNVVTFCSVGGIVYSGHRQMRNTARNLLPLHARLGDYMRPGRYVCGFEQICPHRVDVCLLSIHLFWTAWTSFIIHFVSTALWEHLLMKWKHVRTGYIFLHSVFVCTS